MLMYGSMASGVLSESSHLGVTPLNEASQVFKGELALAAKNTLQADKDKLLNYLRRRGIDLGRSSSNIFAVSQLSGAWNNKLTDDDTIVFGVMKYKLSSDGPWIYNMVVRDGDKNFIIDFNFPKGNRDAVYVNSEEDELKFSSIRKSSVSQLPWGRTLWNFHKVYLLSASANQNDQNLPRHRVENKSGSTADPKSSWYRETDPSRIGPNTDRSGYTRDPDKYRKLLAGKTTLSDKLKNDLSKVTKESISLVDKAQSMIREGFSEIIIGTSSSKRDARDLRDTITGIAGYLDTYIEEAYRVVAMFNESIEEAGYSPQEITDQGYSSMDAFYDNIIRRCNNKLREYEKIKSKFISRMS